MNRKLFGILSYSIVVLFAITSLLLTKESIFMGMCLFAMSTILGVLTYSAMEKSK